MRLADTGVYVASQSTMYRRLHQEGQLAPRRSERAAQKRSRPHALAATGLDQVFWWDITYLPTQVRGQHFYLYLFTDLFSPQIVGWQVFDGESAELASQLLRAICERQGIAPHQLTVQRPTAGAALGDRAGALEKTTNIATAPFNL